jgi:hypothetical protein
MALGLKGSWRETNGCRFIHRLKELKWNLKYAWQRAWRGWDSRDMFNIDTSFIERQKTILKEYRIKHHGLFTVPEEYRNDFNKLYFDEKETDMIIDTMLYHLELMDEDNVEKLLYGKNVYDDDYNFKEYTMERCKRISLVMDQNKEAFMKLFNLFFWQLWD